MNSIRVSTQTISAFDQPEYLRGIESRGDFIRQVVTHLKTHLSLSTAIDAGAGLGFFVPILQEAGIQVRAFDGRKENVEAARTKYPGIDIEVGDIQNPSICNLGSFDLVLCFGLLYHLENPLLAIRHLRALTRKVLLLESMCFPGSRPWMLLREEPKQEDQSLTDVAFYPSEGCIVKMLNRAGFSEVYTFQVLPNHDDFRESAERSRRRTVLLATVETLPIPGLIPFPEPSETSDPWKKKLSSPAWIRVHLQKFFAKSRRGKYAALARLWMRKFPTSAVPLRLPFGAWWLARAGVLDNQLLEDAFETAELRFVEKFLQPGMVVLDIGAHHGLYTLLASKRVGSTGSVTCFEPSPRERRLLERHLQINFCSNVRVESIALGRASGQADLFLVSGAEDGCNSLRPPAVSCCTRTVPVDLLSLDEYLARRGIKKIDFIKLDVEGAELDVLRGAIHLLRSPSRPLILAEVEDARTRPWGYQACEIIQFLQTAAYSWFRVLHGGSLEEIHTNFGVFGSNLVAVPEERKEEVLGRVRSQSNL
jgi:FkbM family methyltransferase